MHSIHLNLRLGGLLLMLALVAACGKESGSDPASMTAGDAGKKAGSAGEMSVEDAERQTADMVRGVSPGKAQAPIELKFSIASRPALGAPVQIDIAVISTAASDAMTLSAQGGPEINIDSSTSLASFQKSQPGSIYRHKLLATPRAEGAFNISVLVTTVVAGSGSQSRSFAIPLLVGNLAALEKQAAAAAGAADLAIQH